MEKKQKREWVIGYIQDPDLVSDEAIEILLTLMSGNLSKDKILEMSEYDMSQTWDSAYPEPYANQIREIYPEFNNGWHFYDYGTATFGSMVNVYNLFAKRMLNLFK